MRFKSAFSFIVAGLGAAFLATAPAQAHHAFDAEFDASAPVVLTGVITGVEWVNPHAWIHLTVSEAGQAPRAWLVEAGTPNALLKLGVDRASLAAGTHVSIRGYLAKDKTCPPSAYDHVASCKADSRVVTFDDGRTAYIGPAASDCGPHDAGEPEGSDPAFCTSHAPIAAGSLDGEALFNGLCAACHDLTPGRAPSRAAMSAETTAQIVATLTQGVMQRQANGLTSAQMLAVANYVASSVATGGVK